MRSALLAVVVLLVWNGSWIWSVATSSPDRIVNGASSLSESATSSSPYKIILDGGSTGSRLHIFEFVTEEPEDAENNGSSDVIVSANNRNSNKNNTTTVKCVRRGSSRANIPLSAFGRLPGDREPLRPATVSQHLLPLFDYAASIIPAEYHASTGVYFQATAGMRLLEESEQEAVYDALYQGLMEHPSFVFKGMERKDIATLSGEMEAYYGALAANFLQGVIDTELRLTASVAPSEKTDGDNHPVVGALDMGGSSTQIVYVHNPSELPLDGSGICEKTQLKAQDSSEMLSNNACQAPDIPQLKDEHFFSTSYLSYGVDQFRERLWNTLVEERAREEEESPETCGAKVIFNPCANKGFEVEWQGYTLYGTGATSECIRYARRLIPHPENPVDMHTHGKVVGGVEHPPIRGKFLAMSLYFFSLDSLRVFSQPDEDSHRALNLSWPNPSIQELEDALDGLCSRDWHNDMALQESAHSFTRAEVLPHRCLETVYMVTLLKDGFGFHPTSRDITFTFLVDDNEVEWTLGMALAMNAEERYEAKHLGSDPVDEQIEFHNVFNSLYFGVTLPPTHCC
ncbi:GDA1/CD39 nucleoside phosphatase family protein [Nitzschia inconspicua]|uniref:GDA1/CD39 nucleoside phosphatase family protein n=1 Tax=Nitzschia inconspicua TaxID=303405 RepID=A0A9K3KZ50_9STRA|nr:GDA1/CD39 nucleoside phosphatase family protein [Nitzschia inconspicua]